jgi:hypothetical protein
VRWDESEMMVVEMVGGEGRNRTSDNTSQLTSSDHANELSQVEKQITPPPAGLRMEF